MKKTIEVTVLATALMVGAALFVNAQVGLWVSNASGVTTGGKAAITSSASDALSVTGGASIGGVLQSAGVISAQNANTNIFNIFDNNSTGNAATSVVRLEAGTAAAGLVLYGSGHASAPGLLEIQIGAATGLLLNSFGGGPITFAGGRINSNASQAGFLCFNSVDDSFGSGTFTIDCDTEVYDNTDAFSADTFTAQVTGIYELCMVARVTSSMSADLAIATSNRSYLVGTTFSATQGAGEGCVFADMDVSDTAVMQVITDDTPNTIQGSGSPYPTYFSGRLVP